ncbi:MAG: fatty acid hydroxylase family protein [Deltaproteobacteria bacterium]|nr:MAG: fatty acid hydroxylase family protein [Deltaproteobacteria bacterium]
MIDANVLVMPAFVGLMAAEYAVGRARGHQLYSLGGTLDDVASSLTHLVGLAVLGTTTFAMYEALRVHIAVTAFPMDQWWAWVLGWVLSDFCWYWRHRFGHDTSLGWAIHEVHHQSREMNLAVGLRVSAFQWAQTAPFMLPMALLGMPMPMFAAIFGVAHTYQTLLHTQLVDRFGPFGWLLTQPADHRLHHARNPRYLNKNFGHNLIIWDRLFGTYAVEDPADPVVYGIERPRAAWDPVRNNLEPWLDLVGRRAEPGEPIHATATPTHRALGVAWFAVALGSAALLIQHHATWPLALRVAAAVWVLWTFGHAGRVIEGRASPLWAEGSRVALGAAVLFAAVGA